MIEKMLQQKRFSLEWLKAGLDTPKSNIYYLILRCSSLVWKGQWMHFCIWTKCLLPSLTPTSILPFPKIISPNAQYSNRDLNSELSLMLWEEVNSRARSAGATQEETAQGAAHVRREEQEKKTKGKQEPFKV